MNLGSVSVSAPTNPSEVVSDQFPVGLRVLVVDDDPTCLMILERMLRTCLYQVTKCTRAQTALDILRKNKNGFNVVISDVHMPDMDGFKLLEHIGLEMDLPVIMMSADDCKDVVMKGVTHGACDYLIKPVRIEALKNIWQHVVRKKKNELKELEQCGSVDDGDRQHKPSDDPEYSSLANEGNWKNSKKRKDDEEETDERDDTSTLKKPRVVWSVELHQQFVAAVNQLGIDKAVPKKILELMSVPGLTRENVASHLQKYRLYRRRLSGVSQHPSNLMNSQEAIFGSISPIGGIDYQTLAVTGQLPAQSLAMLQAAGLGRSSAKSGITMPLVDQRNLFSFENPKLRFRDGQQLNEGNCKPMNLLHGIPTSMEPKQLASLQSAQSLGGLDMRVRAPGGQNNPLLMQMVQHQPSGQMLNGNTSSHIPGLLSTMGQPIISNGISTSVLGRNRVADSGRGGSYNPVSRTTFPMNQTMELSANSFPLGSSPRIPNISTAGTFNENVISDLKGSGGFVPGYDIFSEYRQQKTNDWDLQNAGLTFDTSPHTNPLPGNIDVLPSVFVCQGSSFSQPTSQNSGAASVAKGMFPLGDVTDQGNPQSFSQHLNTHLIDNPVRVKSERTPDATSQPILFTEQYRQEDLMSALLKQHGSIAPTRNEFDFDEYSMDNNSCLGKLSHLFDSDI